MAGQGKITFMRDLKKLSTKPEEAGSQAFRGGGELGHNVSEIVGTYGGGDIKQELSTVVLDFLRTKVDESMIDNAMLGLTFEETPDFALGAVISMML